MANKRVIFLLEALFATRPHSLLTQNLKPVLKGIQKKVELLLHGLPEVGNISCHCEISGLPVILHDCRENTLFLRTSCEFDPGVSVTWTLVGGLKM